MALRVLINICRDVSNGIYTAAIYSFDKICLPMVGSITPFTVTASNSFCTLARSVSLWAWKTFSISATNKVLFIASFTFCWVFFKVSLTKLSSLSWCSGCNLSLRSNLKYPRIPAQLLFCPAATPPHHWHCVQSLHSAWLQTGEVVHGPGPSQLTADWHTLVSHCNNPSPPSASWAEVLSWIKTITTATTITEPTSTMSLWAIFIFLPFVLPWWKYKI